MPAILLEIPGGEEGGALHSGISTDDIIKVQEYGDNIFSDNDVSNYDIVITVLPARKLIDKEKKFYKDRALQFPRTGFLLVGNENDIEPDELNIDNLFVYSPEDDSDRHKLGFLVKQGKLYLRFLEHFRDCNKTIQDSMTELNKIGIALSSEKDLNRLLEMILREVRAYTHSDAGSLYIKEREDLVFKVAQNDTIDRKYQEKREFKQFRIPISSKSLAGYVAQAMKPLNIKDVSDIPAESPYQHDSTFDEKFGYKTRSILTIPMKDNKGELIGVLQLINALDEKGEPVPFSDTVESLVESLGSQAAVAIKNAALLEEINTLLMSLIEYSSALIDARSRHTSGHSKRVAHLVIEIAMLINNSKEPPFDKVKFNKDQMQELYFAALLHDIGKIGVPESILDKKTRIPYGNIEAVVWKTRYLKSRIIKQASELGEVSLGSARLLKNDTDNLLAKLDTFLSEINHINECEKLSDSVEKIIREVGNLEFSIDNQKLKILTESDFHNLLIKEGNLTEKEREIIQNHINLTIDTLEKIPFPRHLEGVPFFAGQHHEKLDGSGYPRGLKGDEIPLQSRILTIADHIDALSAQDRPYRKGLSMKTTISVLVKDAERGLLDKDIVNLIKKKIENNELQTPWYLF